MLVMSKANAAMTFWVVTATPPCNPCPQSYTDTEATAVMGITVLLAASIRATWCGRAQCALWPAARLPVSSRYKVRNDICNRSDHLGGSVVRTSKTIGSGHFLHLQRGNVYDRVTLIF